MHANVNVSANEARLPSRVLSSLVLLCCGVGATDYPARDDLLVAAVDLASGREIWASRPAKLGDAFLELFPEGLVVFPHASTFWRSNRRQGAGSGSGT